MYLKITYSVVVKNPKNFFDVLKPSQNEKFFIFQEISILKIHV